MTIKITIESDSEDARYFDNLMRQINDSIAVGDKSRVSGTFTKEAKEVPEVQPNRWPRLRNISVDSRAEADEIVGNLRYILQRWGYVTVADLLAEVGKSSESVDTTYGWTSLTALQYRGSRHSGPIQLWLPTPEPVPTRPKGASNTYQARNLKTQVVDTIHMSTRLEAENVLDRLKGLVEQYGAATVENLYNAVGIRATYLDQRWGWKNLDRAYISYSTKGYGLIFTKPELL